MSRKFGESESNFNLSKPPSKLVPSNNLLVIKVLQYKTKISDFNHHFVNILSGSAKVSGFTVCDTNSLDHEHTFMV